MIHVKLGLSPSDTQCQRNKLFIVLLFSSHLQISILSQICVWGKCGSAMRHVKLGFSPITWMLPDK